MSFAATALQYLDAGLLPIPGRPGGNGKLPLVKHKPNEGGKPKWSRAIARSSLSMFDDNLFGLLLDETSGLIVLDFDTVGTFDKFRADFVSEFDATVLCRTAKGYHVWFKRTPALDAMGITDSPLGYFELADGSKGAKMPVDIKTFTSVCTRVKGDDGVERVYRTPAILAVPPSPGKVWVRSPFDNVVQPIPDSVVKRLMDERKGSWERHRSTSVSKPRAKKVAKLTTGTPFWRPRVDLNKHNLAALKFPSTRIVNASEMSSMNATSAKAGYVNGMAEFQLQKGKPCPICSKAEGHKNSYWLAVKADGSQYVCCYSANCKPKGELYHRGVVIPWTVKGLEDWTAALYRSGTPCADTFLGSLRDKYPVFATARDGVFLCNQLLVFKVDTGFIEIAYGFADCIHGWPRVRATTKPWVPLELEQVPSADAWALSTSAAAFCEAAQSS